MHRGIPGLLTSRFFRLTKQITLTRISLLTVRQISKFRIYICCAQRCQTAAFHRFQFALLQHQSRKHANARLIKRATERHGCRGGRCNRKFIRAFARAVGVLRLPHRPSNRRGSPSFTGCAIVSSSSSSSLTGPGVSGVRDALRESARVIHRERDIYLQDTCITCGKEAWRRGGRPRGRSVNWSPALPLIYGNRRDSYGKVTAVRSIKRRAACPRESATAGNES